DEVLNRQRKVIYAERRKVLEGADLQEQIAGMIDDVLDGYVRSATAEGDASEWDLDKLWTAFKQVYPVSFTVDEFIDENGGLGSITPDLISARVCEDAHEAYERSEEHTSELQSREK